MSGRAGEGYQSLTEKEKQTLRLIARGHDAKSTARSLGLSVHTINERLRDARRKMAVSSSREAARLLLEFESVGSASPTPDFPGAKEFGEDASQSRSDQGTALLSGARQIHRRPMITSGVLLMILALSAAALIISAQVTSSTAPTPDASAATSSSEVAETARRFLLLLDEGRWNESYQATSASFREQNTVQVWTAASEKARVPFGAVISRKLVSQENLPAPPDGYEVVKFRTSYANKAAALETVSLRRENGSWRVAGIMID